MSVLGEFKSFAMRGNVVDMAVGIIIGAAFGKIVSSFVNDVIMPPIGVLLGGVNFRDLAVVIQQTTESQAEVVIKYGMFVQTIIDFIIIAFAVFVGVKAMNSMKAKEEAKPPAVAEVPEDTKLLAEIRDLLKKS
ncbi:large conductance mechanosensitive channel [Arsukibacterium tuosuense]|uniref:Large-conductance mechanosensitive channel n=1 Tax=Arsukibacterium tuosuense TaxID=1323745 RepID=A0A285IUQ4_9GAMM|nr:large-conductance mechanosensitive channel protein MscL [Arsukibacterium tuosuense]SNY51427.1 large conductance mechanosensitive channel [Arsukibacterium tuosuense]